MVDFQGNTARKEERRGKREASLLCRRVVSERVKERCGLIALHLDRPSLADERDDRRRVYRCYAVGKLRAAVLPWMVMMAAS